MKISRLPLAGLASIAALLLSSQFICAQNKAESEALQVLFGDVKHVENSYTFSEVMVYDLQLLSTANASSKAGTVRVLHNVADSAFAIEMLVDSILSTRICDIAIQAQVLLTDVGDLRLGQNIDYPKVGNQDSAKFGRASGDREIAGRMSDHFFMENGDQIIEVWADKEASESEVKMGRLWPAFFPNMTALATGNHWGLPTKFSSTDTRKGQGSSLELELVEVKSLEIAETILISEYTFQSTARDVMIERIRLERYEQEQNARE